MVVIVKVALEALAGTVTVGGTVADGSLLARFTTAPPAGAGPLKVTVPWALGATHYDRRIHRHLRQRGRRGAGRDRAQHVQLGHRGPGIAVEFRERHQADVLPGGLWECDLQGLRHTRSRSRTVRAQVAVVERSRGHRRTPVHAVGADVELVMLDPAAGAAILPRQVLEGGQV